jgi:hypothetical protein
MCSGGNAEAGGILYSRMELIVVLWSAQVVFARYAFDASEIAYIDELP